MGLREKRRISCGLGGFRERPAATCAHRERSALPARHCSRNGTEGTELVMATIADSVQLASAEVLEIAQPLAALERTKSLILRAWIVAGVFFMALPGTLLGFSNRSEEHTSE